MSSTISPNMGLIVPGVGTEPGPAWANELNSDLGILDQHDHSAGRGVPITPNGLNITSDLPINGNNLTLVKTVNFDAQLAALPGVAPNLGAIYVAGNELYYNDEVGNVVQITNGGVVNSGAGSISGLPSGTASASYSAGPGTFIWQSSTSTAANMDNASVTIREQVALANGVTLKSPNSLAANYDLIFPAALPGSTKFLTVDTSGNIGDVYDVDNSTIEVAANVIQVKAGGITNTQVNAAANIDGSKLADASVSVAKLAPMPVSTTVGIDGFAQNGPTGAFSTNSTGGVTVTNSTITITTSGRPVLFAMQTNTMGAANTSMAITGTIANQVGTLRLFRNAGLVSGYIISNQSGAGTSLTLPGMLQWIDFGLAAGTYTYNLDAMVNSPNVTVSITDAIFVAYEI